MVEPQELGQTRRHHYVPVFLLKGFTPSGEEDDFLWVHDREQDRRWRVRPNQAAHERDYYRVEITEIDPNIVEDAFCEVEDRVSPVIRDMLRSRELPRDEDFQVLIQFVALLAFRTPSFRGLYERNIESLYRSYAKLVFSRRALFEEFVEHQRQQGREIPPEITYEGIRDFAFDDDRCTVEVPRTKSVQVLLQIWRDLIPIFLERQWSLFSARQEEGHLFCSDMPISITRTSPNFRRQFLGFGTRQTELTVPLSRSLALVGSYESTSVTSEIPLGFIRVLNRRTFSFAERFLYSSERDLLL